ncbi:MAG: hypothetical protein U0M12_09065 [Acutalibacteraceae bacterium]|nr:hypothetical protein [Acutalibacteraceae bacterium]
MKIESITVANDGYAHCQSNFYSANDILYSASNYNFLVGTNKLIGDIDSGV